MHVGALQAQPERSPRLQKVRLRILAGGRDNLDVDEAAIGVPSAELANGIERGAFSRRGVHRQKGGEHTQRTDSSVTSRLVHLVPRLLPRTTVCSANAACKRQLCDRKVPS